MNENHHSLEEAFYSWLKDRVSPAQLSSYYEAIVAVDKYCQKKALLPCPLLETDDLAVLQKVQQTVERSRTLRFFYRQQTNKMSQVIRQYITFLERRPAPARNTKTIETEKTSALTNVQTSTPPTDSLIARIEQTGIPYIDNRSRNGALWIIGGKELRPFVDACAEEGVYFRYKSEGACATKGAAAWWTVDGLKKKLSPKINPSSANAAKQQKKAADLTAEQKRLVKSNRTIWIDWMKARGIVQKDILGNLFNLQQCGDLAEQSGCLDTDIFLITSPQAFQYLTTCLFASDDYCSGSEQTKTNISAVVHLYLAYLQEKDTQPEAVAEEPASTLTGITSEVDILLSDEQFAPLRQALAKQRVYTIQELKTLKLWPFMNRNNLYTIATRQVILQEVQKLLYPSQEKDADQRYRLVCGDKDYTGDTAAETFLYFCEDIACQYPLKIRNLLGLSVPSTSLVALHKHPGEGAFLKMENPTAYIDETLTADDVRLLADWLAAACHHSRTDIRIEASQVALPAPTPEEPASKSDHHGAETGAPADETADTPATPLPGTPQPDVAQPVAAEETEPPADQTTDTRSCYRLSCDDRTYIGDTAAETFLYFCEEMSRQYPQKIRNIIGLRVPTTSLVAFYRRPGEGTFLKLDYPIAYIKDDLTAEEVQRLVEWIASICSSHTHEISIEAPPAVPSKTETTTMLSPQPEPEALAPEPDMQLTLPEPQPAPEKPKPPAPQPKPYTRTSSSSTFQIVDRRREEQDQATIEKMNDIVLAADLDGMTLTALRDAMGLTMAETKRLLAQAAPIVDIRGTLLHQDIFLDWDEGVAQLAAIIDKLMQKNNGYLSDAQLYDYARAEMNLFLKDNELDDAAALYDLAQHLFEKNSYQGKTYTFNGKHHISQDVEVRSISDLCDKYAQEQGGIFRLDDLKDYLTGVGLKTGNLRGQLYVNSRPDYLCYDEGVLVYSPSLHIDDDWKQRVQGALARLLDDADGHIALRAIPPFWYDQLPPLPSHQPWTPLLLQYILRFYGQELGARTIAAMTGQSYETLHTMLVQADSPIETFGDVVIAHLLDHGIEQRTFEAEALRLLLREGDLLAGNELIWNMPKALSHDGRFAWDIAEEHVTIRV